MPLGAFRINTLGKVLDTGVDYGERTSTSLVITPKADAQISTAQSQFGGSSIKLDGSGDYLRLNTDTTSVDFSGDLTIEIWVRFDEATTYNHKIFDLRGPQSAPALADTLLIDFDAPGSGIRCFIDGANRVSSGPSISANTWYHMALVRSGSTFNFWIDGTRYVNYTAAGVTDYTVDYSSVIGVDQYNQNPDTSTGVHAANNFEGYMDEIRWSDVARYSLATTITVPNTAFTADGATLLLIHGDGTNGSTTITDDPPAPTGLAAIDPGTIRIGSSTITTKPASDSPQLTLSFWWRQNSDGTNDHVFNMQSGTSTTSFPAGTKLLFCEIFKGRVRLGSYGDWDIQVTDTGANPESTFGNGWWDNNWHHFVYSINSSNVDTLYVDGVDRTSSIYSTPPGSGDTVNWSTFNRMSLLSFWGATSDFSGGDITQVFIDNSYYDLSNATTRAKFYDGGAVDMGSDGTGTGLTQPLVFHTGDTTTFFDLGGDTSRFNYGNTTTGTADGDISASDGPQF